MKTFRTLDLAMKIYQFEDLMDKLSAYIWNLTKGS